jgi:hypothetical protein
MYTVIFLQRNVIISFHSLAISFCSTLQINSVLDVGQSAYSQIQKIKGKDDPESLKDKTSNNVRLFKPLLKQNDIACKTIPVSTRTASTFLLLPSQTLCDHLWIPAITAFLAALAPSPALLPSPWKARIHRLPILPFHFSPHLIFHPNISHFSP